MTRAQYSHHRALLILALLSASIVSVLYGYVYYQISQSIDHALLARDIVKAGTSDKHESDKISKLHASTTKDRAEIVRHFISSTDVVLFIETIENIGTQAGSVIKMSGLVNTAPTNEVGSIRAHVEGHGSWHAIMQTLLLAETLPYMTTVDAVRLNKVDVHSASSEWQIGFDVTMLTLATSSPSQK